MKFYLSGSRHNRFSLPGWALPGFVFVLILAGTVGVAAEELFVTTAAEIMAESEPMLHKQLYVIHTRAVPGREKDIMGDVGMKHMAFQVELEKKGIMFAAGPLMNQDERTYGGEGLVIIRARNLVQARAIAASDPMHAAGSRTYTVQPWLINEGGFSLSVSFSDGSYTLE